LKILVIIPAYNEEKSISDVIKKVIRYIPEAEVLVINDGSIDNTYLEACNSGATVINLPYNLGIGGAMQTGFLYAKCNEHDIVVQIDGDGQHNPEYAKKLLNPIMNGSADMVIGSRFITETQYKAPFCRKMGIMFFSILVSLLINQKVTDTTSGFRAMNKKVIDYFSENYPTDYPEVDVLVKLNKKRIKIIEVPVKMNERLNGKSSITPLRSIYYVIKVSLSILLEFVRSKDKHGGELI